MLQTVRKAFFLPFFFKKKKKARPRAKRLANFTRAFFFKLLVAQLLLRTDAIPSSRVFIRYALYVIQN